MEDQLTPERQCRRGDVLQLQPLISNLCTQQHSPKSLEINSSVEQNSQLSSIKMPDAKEQQPQMSEQDAADAQNPNHPAHPKHPHVCSSPNSRFN